jgi:hypothetical protein
LVGSLVIAGEKVPLQPLKSSTFEAFLPNCRSGIARRVVSMAKCLFPSVQANTEYNLSEEFIVGFPSEKTTGGQA